MGEVSFFRCERCGNIITKIIDAGPTPFCCGEQMVELTANTVDAAVEKHVPVISIDGDKVTVTVGAVDHPMLEEHYIQWIELLTPTSVLRHELKPGCKPEAEFCTNEECICAREYCNLHGLWKA